MNKNLNSNNKLIYILEEAERIAINVARASKKHKGKKEFPYAQHVFFHWNMYAPNAAEWYGKVWADNRREIAQLFFRTFEMEITS